MPVHDTDYELAFMLVNAATVALMPQCAVHKAEKLLTLRQHSSSANTDMIALLQAWPPVL